MHRADFHKALLDAVVKHGVEVRCNARVVEYDYDGPRVKTADGTWHSADLVIAADGTPPVSHRIVNARYQEWCKRRCSWTSSKTTRFRGSCLSRSLA